MFRILMHYRPNHAFYRLGGGRRGTTRPRGISKLSAAIFLSANRARRAVTAIRERPLRRAISIFAKPQRRRVERARAAQCVAESSSDELAPRERFGASA